MLSVPISASQEISAQSSKVLTPPLPMIALSTKTAGGHLLAFWPLIALNLDSKEGYEEVSRV